MAQISKILASYAVSAAKTVQVTNNLWQIDDGHSNYALKRSKLNPQSVRTWENVLHMANSRHITHILPVYLTVQHALYTTADNAIYYLTPWIETEEGSIDRLYHGLGSLHVKTKQSYPAGKENNSEAFLAYKNHCRQADEFLLQCVERFEKNRYMSPFELQVCMQYRDLELAGRQREKHIDQFLKEQEDQDHKWNYSLCHGNVRSSHVLHGNQTYFINWENASYTNAVHDLTRFFISEAAVHDAPVKEMIDRFHVYMEENELTKSELYLLTINLLDPASYISCVEKYPASQETMAHQLKMLMHAYRRIIFGLHWSNYVEKTYETLVLDDLESS